MHVLGIDSFEAVKKRMSTMRWKRLQRLSYLIFFLTYVHLALMLAPEAISGGSAAIVSAMAYTAVFGLYLVLRLWCRGCDLSESGTSTHGERAICGECA